MASEQSGFKYLLKHISSCGTMGWDFTSVIGLGIYGHLLFSFFLVNKVNCSCLWIIFVSSSTLCELPVQFDCSFFSLSNVFSLRL